MPGPYDAPQTATKLVITAMGLIDTFDAAQSTAALIPDFEDPRRLDWDIIPRPDRTGVSLHRLDRHQKVLVWDLIRMAVPLRTFTKVLAIPQMEHVLRDYEQDFLGPALQSWRTSDSYFLTFFGRPGFEDTWSMRFLGHHVCLNITVIEQHWICATPCALGAQPTDYDGVLTPLADDEGLGFALLRSLDAQQQAQAIIHDVAPADFVTRQVAYVGQREYPDTYDLGMPDYTITDSDRKALKFEREAPSGVCAAALGHEQQQTLWDLLNCYLGRLPGETIPQWRQSVRDKGLDRVFFAWAGGLTRGVPHYFRVQTDDLLVEAVNAVGGANHLHTVLRDLNNDFGREILKADIGTAGAWGPEHLRTRNISSSELDPGLE